MKRARKTIAICSSASFYKQVLDIEKQLKKAGFKVSLPEGAAKLSKGNFDPLKHKRNYQQSKNWQEKTRLIKSHFKKILAADAVLIVNDKKNNYNGYIGGNVLMEMTLAFHFKKPIYILNPIDDALPLKEEVYGLQPVFLNKDMTKIRQ